jgi:hypothetical protein
MWIRLIVEIYLAHLHFRIKKYAVSLPMLWPRALNENPYKLATAVPSLSGGNYFRATIYYSNNGAGCGLYIHAPCAHFAGVANGVRIVNYICLRSWFFLSAV